MHGFGVFLEYRSLMLASGVAALLAACATDGEPAVAMTETETSAQEDEDTGREPMEDREQMGALDTDGMDAPRAEPQGQDGGDTGGALDADAPTVEVDGGRPPMVEDVVGPGTGCVAGSVAEAWQLSDAMLINKRAEPGNVVFQGRIFVFGGVSDSTTGPAAVEVFDPQLSRWSQVATMPEPRNHLTAGHARYGDEVWIVGGRADGAESGGVTRVDVFDLVSHTFRRGPDLPEPHWGGPTVVVGDTLHVLTGAVSAKVSSTHHFVLDLRDEQAGFQLAAEVPEARVHAAAVPYEGKIWLIGGEYHHSHDGDTTTVQIYDPENDTWDVNGPELPVVRSHHEWSTFVHEGEIWIVSVPEGVNKTKTQLSVYRYDGQQWRQWIELPAKLVSPGARVVGDVLYVYGGGVDRVFSGTMRDTWTYCLTP